MTGRDAPIDMPWYETRVLNRTFCGKMIVGHFWHDDGFSVDRFCEPSCVDVKRRLPHPPRAKSTSRQPKRV